MNNVGRYSVVCIAICYGLDGPGIESKKNPLRGEIFRIRPYRTFPG
jgi:hypothetical protein